MCMSEINIIPIGSSSSGNSIYVEIKNYSFLIDMGISYKNVKNALEANNRDLSKIDAIFVTHGHYDHIKAYKAICNNTNCNIYSNETVLYNLKDANAEKIVLDIDKTYEVFPDLNVRMFLIPHDFVKTCGFSFKYGDIKLGYLTDCGRMNDKILKELSGSDVVIIESNHDIDMLKKGPYPKNLQNRILSEYGHLSNEESALTMKKLSEKGTKSFILAHLSKKNNDPILAYNTALKYLDSDCFVYVCPENGIDLLSF